MTQLHQPPTQCQLQIETGGTCNLYGIAVEAAEMAESTRSGKLRTERDLTHQRVHAQDAFQGLRSDSPGHGSASDITTDISSLELFTNQLGHLSDSDGLNPFIYADNLPRSVTSAL